MKLSKKLGAAALAMVMAMGFATQSFALMTRPTVENDNYDQDMVWHPVNHGSGTSTSSITISNTTDDHTYTAYQIFSGAMAHRQKLYIPADGAVDPNGNTGYPAYNVIKVARTYQRPADYTETDPSRNLDAYLQASETTETTLLLYKKPVPDSTSPDSYPVVLANTTYEKYEAGQNPLVYDNNDPSIVPDYNRSDVDTKWYLASTDDLLENSMTESLTDTTVTRYSLKTIPYAAVQESLQDLEWGKDLTAAGIQALAAHFSISPNATVPTDWPADGKTPQEWFEANGVSATKVAEKMEKLTNENDIRALADLLMSNDSYITGGKLSSFNSSTKEAKITLGTSGYYVVRDNLKDGTSVEDKSLSRYMLRVAGDVTVQPKASIPSLTKKVYENSAFDKDPSASGDNMHPATDHSNTEYVNHDATATNPGGNWNDLAHYNMGDKVPFQIACTLPETYEGYYRYYFQVEDTLSKGLTFNKDAKVYLFDPTSGKRDDVTTAFTITENAPVAPETNTKITITCNNLKAANLPAGTVLNAAKVILVEYTATLNGNAVVGSAGNPNTAKLIYSNDPNYKGDGTNEPTGETPKDVVTVYTFQLHLTKIGSVQNSTNGDYPTLIGAEFVLQRDSDKKFAEVDKTTGKVVKWVDTQTDACVVASATGGVLNFIGLDAGHYQLIETKAPSGYNMLAEPIKFTITAEKLYSTNSYDPANNPWNAEGTKLVITITNVTTDTAVAGTSSNGSGSLGDKTTGAVSMFVKNASGNQLPTTGGMGTTLFYVLGGMMAFAAAVLLIVKRRMENEQ